MEQRRIDPVALASYCEWQRIIIDRILSDNSLFQIEKWPHLCQIIVAKPFLINHEADDDYLLKTPTLAILLSRFYDQNR